MFSVHIIITCRYVFRKYYTDNHDVDEDARTIVRHGGWYVDGNLSGFTCRLMYETPTNTSESVASKNNA